MVLSFKLFCSTDIPGFLYQGCASTPYIYNFIIKTSLISSCNFIQKNKGFTLYQNLSLGMSIDPNIDTINDIRLTPKGIELTRKSMHTP